MQFIKFDFIFIWASLRLVMELFLDIFYVTATSLLNGRHKCTMDCVVRSIVTMSGHGNTTCGSDARRLSIYGWYVSIIRRFITYLWSRESNSF